MDGWIKLHRKLMASDIFQNEKLLKVFIYCMLKASHAEHEQKIGRQTISLKPGQFVFGRKKAAHELSMKESTVRDYMVLLKKDKVIDIKSTNKFSVITVVNWEVYQAEEKIADNKLVGRINNKSTSNGQQIDTNKNGKKEKNNIQQQQAGSESHNWVHTYEMCYGIPSMKIIDLMNSYLDEGMEQKTLSLAIEKASENGQPFHYSKGILNNWISKGILTIDAAIAEEKEYNERKVERIHANEKRKRPQINRPSVKGADISKYDFSSTRNSL